MKYPKESLPKKPTQNIADKKFGFFQSDKNFFEEVAQELGLISNKSNGNIGYERHPLAYLVEAADDICYTIIDFEDGINLGLVNEDFALEYMIKLVQDSIDTQKYKLLTTKEDRISYLRALAIGNLIQDAVKIFLENESSILSGDFPFALMDKSQYKAQMNDIIQISVKNIYQSREVVEKEIKGYQVINRLLDVFITAYNHQFEGKMTNFDQLVLKLLPEKYQIQKENLYERLMHISHFVSLLTDGKAMELNHILSSQER
jgi:dGTPase